MELNDTFGCVAIVDFFLQHAEDFAIYVFVDFLLVVASLLQSIKKLRIVTS